MKTIVALAFASTLLTSTAASAQVLTFSGTRENVNPLTPPGGRCVPPFFNTVNIAPGALSSTGTSNISAFSSTQSHCLTSPPPTSLVDGLFTYTFEAGDSISGTYTGNVVTSAAPGVFTATENLIITGGTGRFIGASGTIADTGSLTFANGNGIFSGTVAGSILATATTASGAFSTAFGTPSAATGDYASTFGAFSLASGSRSTALGTFAEATGPSSIAVGDNSFASGDRSVAIGQNARATNVVTTAVGNAALATGLNATAIGNVTQATGMGATALGNAAVATSAGSVALGVRATSSADFATASETEIFQLGKPGALANLTYSNFGSYAGISANSAGSGPGYISFLTLGTASTDRPIVGTASYTGAADGLWDNGTTVRRLFGSEVSLIANFGAGTLQTTLNLVGRGDPFGNFMAATATPLGSFTGTGALSSNSALFTGLFNTVNGYSGSFDGLFYGPGAVEFGYLFSLSNGAGGKATGVAVGRKP